MIVPHQLEVQGWAQWRKASLRLDEPGITMVRGRNLDDLGNPNRAGKSTLFNAMSAIVFGEHQLAVRKKSLKSLTNASTRINLSFDNDDHDVRASLRVDKLRVTVDGDHVDAHKLADEQAALLRLYGCTSDLHYATRHVNGIASNPLIRGTSSNRCQFLERAFDLDRWSPLHSKVGEVITTMRRADEELDRVRDELKELGPIRDVDRLRAKVTDLEAKSRKVSSWLEQALVVRGRIEALPPKPKMPLKIIEAEMIELRDRITRAEKVANDVTAWKATVATRAALEAKIAELVADRSSATYDVSALESRIDKLERNLINTDHYDESALDPIERWLELASKLASEHGIAWDNLDQLQSLSRGWARSWKAGQASCAVCGSRLRKKIDGRDLNALVVALRALPRRVFDPDGLHAVLRGRKDLATCKKALAEAIRQREVDVELVSIRRRLKDNPLPERMPEQQDVEAMRERRNELERLADAARRHAKVRIPDGLTVASLGPRIDHARKLQERIADGLDQSKTSLQVAESERKRRAELERRRGELEDEVALRPAYKALHVAYSPSGMRLWMLQELVEALISGLNQHSSTMRDGQQYGYKLSRNRDLLFTVSNLRGTYDIRFLSGAESSMFVLGLLTVLLPMLPSNRRSNLLVLDEIDANCSHRSREIISQEYLPRLKKTVGTIFVVTPMTARDFHMPGARELTVVKRGGISSIAE